MAFTARDVIVYLTDFPYKFLVPLHTGVVTRSAALTNFSKVTNYRNRATGGYVSIPTPIDAASTATVEVAPVDPITSPFNVATDALVILDDPTAEMGGVTGSHGPRPESFTRYKLTFSVVDEVSSGTSPYSCWEDEFRALGGIDPLNELDE